MKDRRLRSDRRMNVRGGRRVPDHAGNAPMIVVIHEDSERRNFAEAVLARCHFAVAPFYSAESALTAMGTLRAEAVVASPSAAAKLRVRLPTGPAGRTIPALSLTHQAIQPEWLVDSLRRLLRTARHN